MSLLQPTTDSMVRLKQALFWWGVYFAVTVLINGTLLFLLGWDLHGWSYSAGKDLLVNLLVYSGLFLVVPLILTKGWDTVRQPGFIVPLLIAILAMTLRTYYRPVSVLAVLVLIYLHWRYGLSELGIRSSGWQGDLAAVLIVAALTLVPRFTQPLSLSFSLLPALQTALDRMFFNPATTTEYLFYFGFLAGHLYGKLGKWWTPLLVGLMYTAHEMSNPEYWYEGVQFGFVFVGVTLFVLIYIRRRSVVVFWLGDGLGRFLSRII